MPIDFLVNEPEIDNTQFSETQDDKAKEDDLFVSLRADSWDSFFGQKKTKKSLQIAIKAAKERSEPLDHILLYGPPGLGKTTLSHLISKELGVNLKITSGTAMTKAGDLAAILTNLQEGDVLFIDEIHRLPKVVEETLYPAMEDYALDIIIGKGPSARTIRIDLPKFTIVGATTRFGLLTGPFRDRFGIIHRLEFYDFEALATILQKAGEKLGIIINQATALEIGQRARGTPRIALKLLKRVRDFAQVNKIKDISVDTVHQALDLFSIDILGLEDSDRRFIKAMIEKHNGGPVGLSTISAVIHEDPLTIEEVIEPYLIQIGFLKRTPKGRVVTKKAYQHLEYQYPEGKEE